MYQLSGEALRLADHLIVIMSHECGHGGNVLSDAGFCRCYSGRRRYEVQYGDEYDQYVGDCHAIILCGSILVEAAGRTGRHRDSVGSVL